MLNPACLSLQGYENPEKFDPDRFGPERKEDIKFASNYLVFGHGPHYCVGKEVRAGGRVGMGGGSSG